MSNIELTIIATTLIILLLIATVAIVIFIANRQRLKQQAKYERELRTAEQEVQESVLTNLAQELHDNIGQLLTVMYMQAKKEEIKQPELKLVLAPIVDTINETTDQVRALGRSLNTDMLRNKGLVENMTMEIERIRTLDKFSIDWQCTEDQTTLPKGDQLLVFRIFQELMNNTMKHAAAKQVSITLRNAPFKLVVKDDGLGFDLQAVMKKGMGMQNIVKRARIANLSCDINTSPGEGCTFTIYQSV